MGLPCWDVLFLLAHDRDLDALEGWTQHHYQQHLTARMK
jgi:hypothetical protein